MLEKKINIFFIIIVAIIEILLIYVIFDEASFNNKIKKEGKIVNTEVIGVRSSRYVNKKYYSGSVTFKIDGSDKEYETENFDTTDLLDKENYESYYYNNEYYFISTKKAYSMEEFFLIFFTIVLIVLIIRYNHKKNLYNNFC